jgi:hypothetical protein
MSNVASQSGLIATEIQVLGVAHGRNASTADAISLI